MTDGYVYCLSNPSYRDNLVYIGSTSIDPRIYAYELHTSSVPHPFKLEFAKKVSNHNEVKHKLHNFFNKNRFGSLDREAFIVDIPHVKNVFELIPGEWYTNLDPIEINLNPIM